MTNFPTTLDVFVNPGATDLMDAAGLEHDVQHANANDAIKALQQKLGVDASTDDASLDARVRVLETTGAGGGGVASGNKHGTGSPVGVVTPDALDQFYRRTDVKELWIATGLTSADWDQYI